MGRQIDCQTTGQIVRQTARWTDRQTDRLTHGAEKHSIFSRIVGHAADRRTRPPERQTHATALQSL